MMSYMPSRAPFNHRSSPSGSSLSYPQGQSPSDVHYAASTAPASDYSTNISQYGSTPGYTASSVGWNAAQSTPLNRQSPHPAYTGSPQPPQPPADAIMTLTQAFPDAVQHNGLLQISSFGPDRGPPNERVTVRARIHPGESTDPDRSVRILFDDSPSMAERITRVEQGNMLFELWVRVPNLGSMPASVRLKAQLCSGQGLVQDEVEFGNFEYNPSDPLRRAVAGERRMREEDDYPDRNVRRAVRPPSLPRYHPGGTPRSVSGDVGITGPYGALSAAMSPAASMGAFQSPALHGSPMQTTPLMQGGLWTGGAGPSHHPGMMTPGTLSQEVSLMRTTQIGSGNGFTQNQSLGKVTLELQGKLSNMALGWSHEEVAASRRLVQFSRSLEDGILKVQFRPIKPEAYVHGTVVVSCIYRRDGAPDERDKCYITSVDALQLLEAIIATPFSVEEKNRIRRNLEGFKPITVSKHKPDQENFFKLIMEFQAPKPRNIEKDVKVFKWEHLEQALHKIIDKYSVTGITDASQGLLRERSRSPRTDVHPSPTPARSRVVSGRSQILKAEPVDSAINDFQYGETYELADHDASQGSLGIQPGGYDQYSMAQPSNNIQYSLPSMPSYDPASNGATDITNDVGWNPMDYLTDPPSTGGVQQAASGSTSAAESQPMYAHPPALSTPQKDQSRAAPSS